MEDDERFLDGFPETSDEKDPLLTDRRTLARSAGVTVGTMILVAFAFVGGVLWATSHEPDLDYSNVAAELAIKIGYAVLLGLLAVGIALAAVALAVGIPWVRRRRSRR